jgi:uncharacterized iron-regulated membrane protein
MIRRIIVRLHLWIGLALCAPLAVIGLTGSILVFEDELQGTAAKRDVRPGQISLAADIIAAARAAAPPGFSPSIYLPPAASGSAASVRLTPPQRESPGFDSVRVRVDPVTLEAAIDRQAGLLRQIFYLHSTLLLKSREGRQLIGWLGLAMLLMGVSGLVNWWPRRSNWRSAFAVTRRARGYRLQRELHGAAGAWGLAALLTVSFAGVYLAFPETVRSAVGLVFPTRDLRAAVSQARVAPVSGVAPADIDEAIALARAEIPGAVIGLVSLPARPDRPYRVAVFRSGQDRRTPAVAVLVDPWTRRVIVIYDPQHFSLGEKIIAWQHALHAGQGLGWVWKSLVFLSGLLPLLLAISGFAMWRLKRRRQLPAEPGQLVLDRVDPAGRAAE